MALGIKRKETVRGALRRIGARLTAKALNALRDCDTLEAVHEVRKDIKRLRALLRLVRSGLSRRVYRRLTKKLKKTASALGPSRDAFIKTAASKQLESHFRGDLPTRPFERIGCVLAEDSQSKQKELPGDLQRSRRLLKKIGREFCSLDAARRGWKDIGPGIRRSYRAGRRACRLARKTGLPEDFHEWRKSAKGLLYQVRFLCGIRPEQMKALETQLDGLGDCLGDAHDLTVLVGTETIKQMPSQTKEEIQTLETLAGRRRKDLNARALRMGVKLYEEDAASFCKRLECYWRRWRRKARPS